MFLLILFILFCYILFLSILDSRKIQRQNSDREQHWPPYTPRESPEIPIDLSDPNASPEMLLAVGNSSLDHAILRLVAKIHRASFIPSKDIGIGSNPIDSIEQKSDFSG
jgi:hypothetical protein